MINPARQFVQTVTTRVVLAVLAGGTSIVIARVLHPEGRGAYYVLITVAATAAYLGRLSIEQAHSALWVDPANRAAIAANSVLLGPCVGAVAVVVTLAAVAGLGSRLMPVPGNAPLLVASAAIPVMVTGMYLNNVLVLLGQVNMVNKGLVLAAGVQAGALFLLAAGGRLTLLAAVLVWAVTAALPLAVLVPAVRPRMRERKASVARRAVTLGARYHPGTAALQLLMRADVLILNALTGNVAVGLYSLAVTLAELTRMCTDATAQIALGRQMGGDAAEAVAVTVRAVRLTALSALVSVGLMCCAAPVLIPVVYGSAFEGSIVPLLGLAPGLLVLGIAKPVSACLLRLDRPSAMSGISAFALLVNVVLNLALIPGHGILGCAVASSVGYSVLGGLQVAWFCRTTGTPVGDLIPGRDDVRYLRAAAIGGRRGWPTDRMREQHPERHPERRGR